VYLFSGKYQVCLDYWNVLVAELFEPHRLENPAAAAASMMGLQVSLFMVPHTLILISKIGSCRFYVFGIVLCVEH